MSTDLPARNRQLNRKLLMGLLLIAAMASLSLALYLPNTSSSREDTIISAHRGGRNIPGYPENALETFALTHAQVSPLWIECDINMSRDSVLFLLHDASLDRTTTGTGQVKRLNWNVIDTCHLVDDFQQVSPWKIPTLRAALAWSKQKEVTLLLDVKRGVPFDRVLAEVEALELADQCMVIVYSAADASKVYQLNPQVRISANIRNEEELQQHIDLKIPLDRLYAFVGTRLPPIEHVERLKAVNVPTILGSLGNLDQRAAAKGDELYCIWGQQFDVLATDRPVAVYEALQDCQ